MIRLENVSFAYLQTAVLQNITLNIQSGEFVGIIGPNGAGKSTLLKLMAGMLHPASGEVRLGESSLSRISRRDLARKLGFVGQSIRSEFDYTAYEMVAMGRFPHTTAFAPESREDRRIIQQCMTQTEVWQFRERAFSQLSGGEQQRVILASALCQQPQILLLDEPTASLDLHHQQQFFGILRDLQSAALDSIVTVTHDINLAIRFCRRLLVLKTGQIVADDAPERVVTESLMAEVYETPVAITTHPCDGKPLVSLP